MGKLTVIIVRDLRHAMSAFWRQAGIIFWWQQNFEPHFWRMRIEVVRDKCQEVPLTIHTGALKSCKGS